MRAIKIIFPTKNDCVEKYVVDKNSGERFIENLLLTIDRISCENEIEIFFDLKNKHDFIDDYSALMNLLGIKIGNYRLETFINLYVVKNYIKELNQTNNLLKEFALFNSFEDVDLWITGENSYRKIDRFDFRHCEYHPNRIHSKSPLIGGVSSFDNVENLLPSAIGDSKTNKKYLINIDKINNNFIVRYEDENFNNQFHAYHVVKKINNQYVEDSLEINALSTTGKGLPRAFKLINYRNRLKGHHSP